CPARQPAVLRAGAQADGSTDRGCLDAAARQPQRAWLKTAVVTPDSRSRTVHVARWPRQTPSQRAKRQCCFGFARSTTRVPTSYVSSAGSLLTVPRPRTRTI